VHFSRVHIWIWVHENHLLPATLLKQPSLQTKQNVSPHSSPEWSPGNFIPIFSTSFRVIKEFFLYLFHRPISHNCSSSSCYAVFHFFPVWTILEEPSLEEWTLDILGTNYGTFVKIFTLYCVLLGWIFCVSLL